MAVQRMLGATWASVHGPSDTARMVRWLLEEKFQGLVPAPAPRACDWQQMVRDAADLPFAFPAVRAQAIAEPITARGLAANNSADVLAARNTVQRAVAMSEMVGCHLAIVDVGVVPVLGEVEREDLADSGFTESAVQALMARRKQGLEAALDRVCRGLFDVCKAFPGKEICLSAGRSVRSVFGLDALSFVFEDLSAQKLGYWHDTAIVARREQILGEAQGQWLESFSNRLSGCTLGDATDDGMYLPPGSGGVDYPLLGAYLPRAGKGVLACLELDPAVQVGELPGVRSCLEKFGL